ncbi:MAG: hypothetical protein FD143_2125 [Ignavibacteria bacterium]|nr:MAG: hypothetical protein FD143_2125 [Ignavibacteria bacterium]KAF0158921.1 MAG: hypothetical protein FD188_2403 [Ignavibacteria bacterium]
MTVKKTLLSFVGTNDGGELLGKNDGAILTALKNEKFNEVILLWNEAKIGETTYSKAVSHLVLAIKSRKYARTVSEQQLTLSDVTDYNEIYTKLKKFTDGLQKDNKIQYTAAISSGTPAMQVCWILLAESGDFSEEFPLRLIKVKDPKFGKSHNVEVKLDTSLPKIQRLKNEIDTIKKDLIPQAELNIERGIISIGEVLIALSPMEFCHYRYFSERVLNDLGDEKFSGLCVSIDFMGSIYQYHKESFPDLDLNREDLRKMIKNVSELGIQTFRGNVSKINRKIRESLNNDTLLNTFQISINGKRGAKFYGIMASPEKIKIVR